MDKEVKRLCNVLQRMARTARMNQWTGVREGADPFSIEQYNRILERLNQLDGSNASALFAPLPPESTWSTLSNASRDLLAYYEEEPSSASGDRWSGVWTDPRSGIWIDKRAFKHGMPGEVADLGHFIREKIAEWQDRKRERV